MASKVNVKFVAILSISLVAFAILVGIAGYVLVIKSGAEHARIGDRYAGAGEWDQARRSYSKAVNKEPTVPEYATKWAQAIQGMVPTSETEYRDLLLNDLYSAYTQLSTIKPNDVAAQTQLLEFMYEQFRVGTPTAEQASVIVKQATRSLARFEVSPPADNSWKTLYRYRGIPLASAMNAGGTLEEPALTQTRTDLENALEGDPTDEQAAVSLARWYAAMATPEQAAGRTDEYIAQMQRSVEVLSGFLEANPVSPQAMLEWVIRSNQVKVARATRGMLSDDASAMQAEVRAEMAAGLPKVQSLLISAEPEQVDPYVLMAFSRIESIVEPKNRLSMSRQIADRLIQARPDDSQLLAISAEIDERSGNTDSALTRYDTIAAMENLPVSIDGYIRLNIRRQAKFKRTQIRLEDILNDPDGENKDSLLARATQDRLDFAQQVSAEDPRLFMLDGMIAQISEDLTGARELYKQYNEQTLLSDPIGLWRQVQVSIKLNFVTEAESLLLRMLDIQPGNRSATLALAEVYFQMNRREAALNLFEPVLAIDPDNKDIQSRVQILRAQLDPDAQGTDPVLIARIQTQTLRNGSTNEPGNLEAAAEYLQERIESLGYDERASLDLIQIYLDLSKLDDARAVSVAASQAHPESDVLARFVSALQSDSVTDALVALIDDSERSEIGKTLTKYRVYFSLKQPELAMAEINKAVALDPEYPALVEIRFDNAIGTGDMTLADEMASIAEKLNLDRAGGALYRARVLSGQGNHEAAIALLEKTIAQGKTFPMAFRLLAGEFAIEKNTVKALSTLEQALSLNQEDPPTQLQYIRLLASAGRTEEALEIARRMQATGIAPNYITKAWLELEAMAGGESGRAAAIIRRESLRNISPDDEINNASLAELYILNRQFEPARPIIQNLREKNDSLPLVMLDMRWHTDQGRLVINGEAMDGIAAAQRLFQEYLLNQNESDLSSNTYLTYARFMIARNQIELAMPAIELARDLQTEDSMEATKLLGDLHYTQGEYADALVAFDEILDAGVDTEDQSFRKRVVECQIRLGRFTEALSTLDAIESTDLTTMLQRAEILFSLERTAEARAILDQAVQQNPNNPLVFVRRAEANLGSEQLAGDVMADLETALRIDPKNWRALRLRGVLFWNQNKRDQSIRDIRAAVAANPRLEQLLYGLMNELIGIGRDGQAADIADDTIKARSTDAQLMLNCARVFANHKLWNRAADYTRQAWVLSKDPNVGVLLIDSLVRMTPKRAAEAETVYGDLVTLIPDAANSMLMLATDATVRYALGRESSAVRSLTKALLLADENPAEVLTWAQHVARVYREDTVKAAEVLKQIGADPELQLSELIRGWLEYVTAQQLIADPINQEEGIGMLRALRDRSDADPLSQLAYRLEGTVQYTAKNYDRAQAVWAEGIERFPEDWEMLNNLAYLLGDKLDLAARGLPLAERALKIAPSVLSSHDTLAMLFTKLGRFEDAEKTLNQATELVSTTAQRATIAIAKIKLHLARGEIDQARKLSTDTRSIVFGSVELAEMSQALDELDTQIDSASP